MGILPRPWPVREFICTQHQHLGSPLPLYPKNLLSKIHQRFLWLQSEFATLATSDLNSSPSSCRLFVLKSCSNSDSWIYRSNTGGILIQENPVVFSKLAPAPRCHSSLGRTRNDDPRRSSSIQLPAWQSVAGAGLLHRTVILILIESFGETGWLQAIWVTFFYRTLRNPAPPDHSNPVRVSWSYKPRPNHPRVPAHHPRNYCVCSCNVWHNLWAQIGLPPGTKLNGAAKSADSSDHLGAALVANDIGKAGCDLTGRLTRCRRWGSGC